MLPIPAALQTPFDLEGKVRATLCYDNALCESFFATLECELLVAESQHRCIVTACSLAA